MHKLYEKMMVFIVLSTYYLLNADGTNISLILISFIILFSVDIINRKNLSLAAFLALIVLMFVDLNYLYFFPLLVYVLSKEYGIYGVIALVPVLIFEEWTLLLFSILIFYITYLSGELLKLTGQNRRIRDQLTEDNLRLKAQRNEIMKTHEKDIYAAGLNERNRISRDMHDALGHSLSSSILLIESLQYVKDESELRQSLVQLQGRLKDGMNDIRYSIHNLYDTSIDLESRIEHYVAEMNEYSSEFIYDIKTVLLHEQKIDLLSIVRESLTNIRKHSNASSFKIIMKEHPKFIAITIKDNGKEKKQYDKGMGLQSMMEIVQKYDGVLNTFYDEGFVVHAIFYKEAKKS